MRSGRARFPLLKDGYAAVMVQVDHDASYEVMLLVRYLPYILYKDCRSSHCCIPIMMNTVRMYAFCLLCSVVWKVVLAYLLYEGLRCSFLAADLNVIHYEDFCILTVAPIGLIMPGGQSRPHLLYEGLRCRLSADLK